MEEIRFKVANVAVSEKGIIVIEEGDRFGRHYNVVVWKEGDLYHVAGDRATYDLAFLHDEWDEKKIALAREEEISYTKPSFFGLIKGGTPYIKKGWYELKKTVFKEYVSNNISIIRK